MSGAFLLRGQKLSAPPARSGASPRPDSGCSIRPGASPGFLTEVTFEGPVGRDGKRHALNTGQGQISVQATVRLRAEAKGHAPLTLSPFLDSPSNVQTVTGLADTDLLDWKTFERLREQLANIEFGIPFAQGPLMPMSQPQQHREPVEEYRARAGVPKGPGSGSRATSASSPANTLRARN